MPVLMIFQHGTDLLSISEINHALGELLGLSCRAYVNDKAVPVDEYKGAARELSQGQIYVDLPDLQEDEGLPVVQYEVIPRLDRNESMQGFIDEILEQDSTLKKEIDQNSRDIVITSDESAAAVEAASAIAYVVASETASGVLVRTTEEEEETVWFSDAEEFADFVFGEEEEVDGEDEDFEEEDV